jgi:hypothetical protein
VALHQVIPSDMHVSVVDLDMALKLGRELSFFDRGIELFRPSSPRAFANSRDATIACLEWIWSSWLNGVPTSELKPIIEKFVQRALSLMNTCSFEYQRGLHDLYLLHCAIMASPDQQLAEVASAVVDFNDSATGVDDGDRYTRAWTGVLKHRLLGDLREMELQAEAMSRAVKPINCRRPPKPMMEAWIKKDWSAFRKAQERSFKSLWSGMRKNRFVVSEQRETIEVKITRAGAITTSWCWADNGLALIAAREGIEISYDPLWLPIQSML